MIIDQLFTRPIFEAADPSRLIATIALAKEYNADEPTKEIDLTGRFQGDVKSQMNQAADYLTQFLQSKGFNFTSIQLKYQGMVMNAQNRGAMAPQSDWEKEAEATANQMRAKRPVQNTAPALKEFARGEGGGESANPGMAEGEYDSRKPFGVRYKVFAGREGRMTTREYWTSSEEKLQRAVDKIQALDNFYEIDGYSYPKESQGVAEGLPGVVPVVKNIVKGLGAAAVAGAIPLGAKAEYSSYKLTPEDIEILRLVAAVIYFGMYDKIKHKGTVGVSKDILADLKRISKPVLDFMDDVWIMGVFDKMRVEDPDMYRSYYTTVNDLESATRLHNMFQRLKDRYINGMTPDDKAKFADETGRTHQIISRPRESVNQGVAKGRQIDEVFADQGSGSTDRDNADYMKRRRAANKTGYTGRETKAGTWRVFKDGNAVAAAGPFKSADEAAAWIKKHKQGITEMDKSEPSAGRDTGPREGPEKIAKPITKEKMVKHALDALSKSMVKKDDKKKDVKEGQEVGAQLRRDFYALNDIELRRKYGLSKDYIRQALKISEVPTSPVELAITAPGVKMAKMAGQSAVAAAKNKLDSLRARNPEQWDKAMRNGSARMHGGPPQFPPDAGVLMGDRAEWMRTVKSAPSEWDDTTGSIGMDPQMKSPFPPLMNKLQEALIKEGRVKELADDLKTMRDADFMKKYGKAKAAIRADMKRVDEAGISRLGKKDIEPEFDFRKGLGGDDETGYETENEPELGKFRMGKPVEPNDAATNAFIAALTPSQQDNRFTAPSGWRYVEKDEDPARYGGAQAAGNGLPNLIYDPQSRTLKSADAPALDMSPKSKYKFDRTTQSQIPADGSGANPNIDAATRDRARAYAAQQNAPAAAAKQKVDWKTIYALNKATIGSNPNVIRPRMQLNMPNGTIYLVQPGDTLTKIAAKQNQVNELSTEKLAQYKTAAARDARQADQEGDVKRGDKRFSGIVKATKKQFDNDAKKVDESRAARRALMAKIVNGN